MLGNKWCPTDVVRRVLTECPKFAHSNIWIHLESEDRLVARARYLESLSPTEQASLSLFGIPFAVKDNVDVVGLPTTAACPDFSYIPDSTASAIQKVIDAGAILVGKTNLDQFATGLVGVRSPYGACHNAVNPEYISGGSSSGSAVAVALGLVSFAIGTDTAGSGRVPASFNNIVGLKPTRGLISTSGIVPACKSLDCVSVFALTCEDALHVLSVMKGPDDSDPFSRDATDLGIEYKLSSESNKPFRFGVPSPKQLNFFGNSDTEKLFSEAITRMENIGGKKVEIDYSPFEEVAELLYGGPWVAERTAVLQDFINSGAELLPTTKAILETGLKYKATDGFLAYYRLKEIKKLTNKIWKKIDFLMTPTTGTIYKIAEVEADPIQLNSNLGFYTNFMNMLDLCAVAIPSGTMESINMPFGVTICGPAFKDVEVCEVGNRFHRAQKDILCGTTKIQLAKL